MEMTINLAALRRNADTIIKRSGTALCAVVKCNAYGHGDIECALALRDKAECFAVADISEALRLVGGGIKNDILILSDMYDEKGYPENLIFTAFDELSLMRLLRSGRRFARPSPRSARNVRQKAIARKKALTVTDEPS